MLLPLDGGSPALVAKGYKRWLLKVHEEQLAIPNWSEGKGLPCLPVSLPGCAEEC